MTVKEGSKFSRFLGNIGNGVNKFVAKNHKKITAGLKLGAYLVPWVIAGVCIVGGVYGLPAFLGITVPQAVIEQLQKNKILEAPQELYKTIRGLKDIEKNTYIKNFTIGAGYVPEEGSIQKAVSDAIKANSDGNAA